MAERVPHPQRLYFELVDRCLQPGMRWLDVGCGRQLTPEWLPDQAAVDARLKARAGCFVGIDLDYAALQRNDCCSYRVLAGANALPFRTDSFDLVTSNMVFEHIQQPQVVAAEIRRVLREGGRLLVHTPNVLDVVTVAARLIPNRLHPMVVNWIEGRADEDVYPTYFSFNGRRSIEAILHSAGFGGVRISYLDHPNAYGRLPVIAQIEALWHWVARYVPPLRGTLLVEAQAR